MTSYDAIVVGGGIVGASAAYHLARAGARALLVDRADAGKATAAGAGIIAPEASKVESDAWYAFALRAVDYYPELVERLRADGAGETGYAPADELIVAVSPDEDAPFAATHARMLERQHRHGRPAAHELVTIDADAARKRSRSWPRCAQPSTIAVQPASTAGCSPRRCGAPAFSGGSSSILARSKRCRSRANVSTA